MYELVYSSKAITNINRNDILDILKTATKTNSELDITGCLVYHKTTFVQILEGNEKDVQNIYSKISKDKRHGDVVILYEGKIAKRSFDQWSMAFHSLNDPDSNEKDAHLFEQNLFLLSKVANRTTNASFLFWLNVRKQVRGWLS